MIKISNKKWVIIVFSCISLTLIFLVFRGKKIDKKITKNLDKFELAYAEIKSEKENLKSFDEPNYRSEGMFVDFKFNQDDLKNQKTPFLSKLFQTGLIEEVIITQNKSVVFKLKTCCSEECEENNTGFSGLYIHYLTKSKIEFINENWVKVVEAKSINDWTYYVIWTQKG